MYYHHFPNFPFSQDFLVVGCPLDRPCEIAAKSGQLPLNRAEQQTQMSMWCILQAPLIIGYVLCPCCARAVPVLCPCCAPCCACAVLRAPLVIGYLHTVTALAFRWRTFKLSRPPSPVSPSTNGTRLSSLRRRSRSPPRGPSHCRRRESGARGRREEAGGRGRETPVREKGRRGVEGGG